MTASLGSIARACVATFGFTTLWAVSLYAQSSLVIPLQFDFVNPGAKSLAIGGAFVGIADDATASFANPAGLTQLITPELSGEFRALNTTTTNLAGGRLSGAITNQRNDTVQGPLFHETKNRSLGVHYLAAVYPHPSHRWVVAAYRHELARVTQGEDRERLSSNGVYQKDPGESESRREFPFTAGRALSIAAYGAAGSYQLARGVSIGAGVAAYRFALDSEVDQYQIDPSTGDPNYDVDTTRPFSQTGRGVRIAPTFGLIIDRGRTRIGAVYRQGASFDFATEDATPGSGSRFRVPHTLAVGASWWLTSQILLATEVTQINYSRLVDDFVTDQARASGQEASFTIDDGTELHLGVQYALSRQDRAPLRLRVGTWYDPDHSVHFKAARTPTTAEERLFDERFATALSKGSSRTHFTAGFGATLSSWVEINGGLDLAEGFSQFSASAIVHLAR
jgi:long-chain fatty acid transport protein